MVVALSRPTTTLRDSRERKIYRPIYNHRSVHLSAGGGLGGRAVASPRQSKSTTMCTPPPPPPPATARYTTTAYLRHDGRNDGIRHPSLSYLFEISRGHLHLVLGLSLATFNDLSRAYVCCIVFQWAHEGGYGEKPECLKDFTGTQKKFPGWWDCKAGIVVRGKTRNAGQIVFLQVFK